MAQGVPTDAATVEEFRALYLYSGNASACGRKVKLDERTARKIAERLEADPSFAEDGRKLRARALDKLVAMRMSVAEVAHDRYLEDLVIPETVGDGAVVTIIDKRPEHGKLVLDAEKNAQNLAKIESGNGEDRGGTTEVHIHLADEEPSDGSGSEG